MKKYNVPKVKEHKGIQILTTIWLVPFLAMVIALWLAFQYYTKIGSTIKISFKSNAGLIANQSQIKLRNVTVGMVTKISLSDDGKGIIVKAEMNREVNPYLNEKAKFWIVHANVGSHGVSGLDTLVSGSYIEIHGVKEEYTKNRFIGLEKPYIDTDAEGRYYHLSAPESYNISEGSNIYYRMMKIGRVERVNISPNGDRVNFTIFINKEYEKFINKKSKFYTRSSLSIDFSQGKLDVQIASISHLVHGGISIYTPIQALKNSQKYRVSNSDIFPLYKSLNQLKERVLMAGEESQIYLFNIKSRHKLEIGSPVEFKGFQVGYITDIESNLSKNSRDIESKIYALLYTSTFKTTSDKSGTFALKKLVHNGLKAKLNSSIPIIGAEYIDLVFDKKIKGDILESENYPIFPTINQKKSSNNILKEVEELVVKLKKLPLEKLLNTLTMTIQENRKPIKKVIKDLDSVVNKTKKPIDKIVKKLEKILDKVDSTVQSLDDFTKNDELLQIPQNINTTLLNLDGTLNELTEFTRGYDANSQFSAELSATLQEVSLASESIKRISRKLERKPNSLLLGDD